MQADDGQRANPLDLTSGRLTSEQLRHNFQIQPQTLRLAQYLLRATLVLWRGQNDFVHKLLPRHPGQVRDPANHAVAQRPLVVEESACSSSAAGMLFNIGGDTPSNPARSNDQDIAGVPSVG